jgi:hypothetical protein
MSQNFPYYAKPLNAAYYREAPIDENHYAHSARIGPSTANQQQISPASSYRNPIRGIGQSMTNSEFDKMVQQDFGARVFSDATTFSNNSPIKTTPITSKHSNRPPSKNRTSSDLMYADMPPVPRPYNENLRPKSKICVIETDFIPANMSSFTKSACAPPMSVIS